MRFMIVAAWLAVVLGMAAAPAAAQAPDPFRSVAPAKPLPPKPRPAPPPVAPVVGIRDCADCPEMVLIPAGGFQMGVPAAEAARENSPSEGVAMPVHAVRIGQAFYLGRYHVTRGQYAVFAKATGRAVEAPAFPQSDDHPVVNVSWDDAQAYAKWLSQTTGKTYRLPTEAEWEYAARAGTRTARYWGDSPGEQCQFAHGEARAAKCSDGFANTAPVGHFKPNGFGLHDMIGNAWEWVQDCWQPTGYEGAPSDGSAFETAGCNWRARRGGGFSDSPFLLRVDTRGHGQPGDRAPAVGFRVVRTVGP